MADIRGMKRVQVDPNVWYHITEYRVDNYGKKEFGAQFAENDAGNLQVSTPLQQYWQFQPVNGDDDKPLEGRYAMRCSKTGIFKQLSICYNPNEIANGKTQPCLATSNNAKSQKWDIVDWGNSTYRLFNVENGTNFALDVHQGNPPYMNDDLDNHNLKGQQWLWTSVKNVDDADYSTTFTNLPTSAQTVITSGTRVQTVFDNDPTKPAGLGNGGSSSSSSDKDSSSSGLSAGAAAGIGIGVALGVIILAAIAFAFWYRRRRRSQANAPVNPQQPPPTNGGYTVVEKSPQSASTAAPATSHSPADGGWAPQTGYAGDNSASAHEMSTERPVHEVQGDYHTELDSRQLRGKHSRV